MSIELLFLGTGAAEGNPAAFCRCAQCQEVRRRGGKDLRTRSALRVGAHHKIDAGPDTYAQMLRHGVDMYDIEHLLITHSHGDHLQLTSILDKTMAREVNGEPFHVYLSNPAKDLVERIVGVRYERAKKGEKLKDLVVHGVGYFETFTAGDVKVEALEANHTSWGVDERGMNYLMHLPHGPQVLYALDTGYYREQTWEYLQSRHADAVIMDCTFGGSTTRKEYPDGHLHIVSYLHMLEKMADIGFIDSAARLYATHFNPHQGLNHEQMQERFDAGPFEVTVAYDGLRIEV